MERIVPARPAPHAVGDAGCGEEAQPAADGGGARMAGEMSELPREALAMGEIVAVVARDDGRARVLEGGVERGRKAGGGGMGKGNRGPEAGVSLRASPAPGRGPYLTASPT